MRHESGLDRDAPCADGRNELGPARDEVVVRLHEPCLGCLTACLDRVAAVGEDDQVVRTDEEAAGIAADLLLAVGESEARQVSHVLAPDAEIGIDAFGGESGSNTPQPDRSRLGVGGVPPRPILLRWRRTELGRVRPPSLGGRHGAVDADADGAGDGFRYLAMFAWCSLRVFAKTVVPEPSPLARK